MVRSYLFAHNASTPPIKAPLSGKTRQLIQEKSFSIVGNATIPVTIDPGLKITCYLTHIWENPVEKLIMNTAKKLSEPL